MKTYIAGKITGDENYQDKFSVAAHRARSMFGGPIISPAVLEEGMDPVDYMRICLAMIDCADIVVFLPDWQDSKGAQLEWAWCQYTGKQTYYMET